MLLTPVLVRTILVLPLEIKSISSRRRVISSSHDIFNINCFLSLFLKYLPIRNRINDVKMFLFLERFPKMKPRCLDNHIQYTYGLDVHAVVSSSVHRKALCYSNEGRRFWSSGKVHYQMTNFDVSVLQEVLKIGTNG